MNSDTGCDFDLEITDNTISDYNYSIYDGDYTGSAINIGSLSDGGQIDILIKGNTIDSTGSSDAGLGIDIGAGNSGTSSLTVENNAVDGTQVGIASAVGLSSPGVQNYSASITANTISNSVNNPNGLFSIELDRC